MSTPVTLRGRMVRDPELSYSGRGTAVARFAVVTSRSFKDDAGNWQEKDTSFWNCVAFGQLAENIAESLEKGTAVVVVGNAAEEHWETKEGEKRKAVKVTAEEVAPSLKFASAKVSRSDRSGGQFQGTDRPHSGPAPEDPWATSGPSDSEPPF